MATLAIISNPRRTAPVRTLAKQALANFKRFHGGTPKVSRIALPAGAPKFLISLGDAKEIIYSVRKGARRGAPWVHTFGKGAKLAASPDGKNIYIVRGKGGKTHVDFDRGIIS